jgi:cytochrome c oxidase subunit 3
MDIIMNEPVKRIHPYKFLLWIAMGSIIMMFAGLTSAYIVKRNQSNWQGFELPRVFWYSTGVIIFSSILMMLCVRSFKERQMAKYRQLLTAVAVLGVVFIILQCMGFGQLNANGIKLIHRGSNVAGSFLFVIVVIHIAHIIGGIIALLVMFIRGYVGSKRNYSPVPVEVMATYWHFVDFLWIYLFIFLNWIQ